jgi:hypothetical protein
LKLGLGPLASPTIWLGLTQPNGYWVGQTNPVRPLALTSLYPKPLLQPRSPPMPPEESGPLRWFPPPSFEANDCLHAACLSTKWIWNPSPVRGDPLIFPTRVPASWPSLSLATAALARSGVVSCCDAAGRRVGVGRAAQVGLLPLPPLPSPVKSSLGRV